MFKQKELEICKNRILTRTTIQMKEIKIELLENKNIIIEIKNSKHQIRWSQRENK